jgi:hypothetical protein
MDTMMFRSHTYTWEKPFGSVSHQWSVIGPTMAVSFHVSVNPEYGDSAGLELHYFEAPDYMRERAPSHVDCKFTGGRCWHDGTSLYAIETLWPMIQPMLRNGDHETIFGILEGEIKNRVKTTLERLNASPEDES